MKRIGKKFRRQFYEPDTDIEKSVVSSTECTGLTYATPTNDEQADAYADLYNVPVTPRDENKDCQP